MGKAKQKKKGKSVNPRQRMQVNLTTVRIQIQAIRRQFDTTEFNLDAYLFALGMHLK